MVDRDEEECQQRDQLFAARFRVVCTQNLNQVYPGKLVHVAPEDEFHGEDVHEDEYCQQDQRIKGEGIGRDVNAGAVDKELRCRPVESVHLSHDVDAYAGAGKAAQVEKAAKLRVRVDIGLFADAFEQDETDDQRAEDTDKDCSCRHSDHQHGDDEQRTLLEAFSGQNKAGNGFAGAIADDDVTQGEEGHDLPYHRVSDKSADDACRFKDAAIDQGAHGKQGGEDAVVGRNQADDGADKDEDDGDTSIGNAFCPRRDKAGQDKGEQEHDGGSYVILFAFLIHFVTFL